MNNREKQLQEIERYKVLTELKEVIEEDDKLNADTNYLGDEYLLRTLPSKARNAIKWAIQFLESEEQNND